MQGQLKDSVYRVLIFGLPAGLLVVQLVLLGGCFRLDSAKSYVIRNEDLLVGAEATW